MENQRVSGAEPVTGLLLKEKDHFPVIVALYVQAHETRRTWEKYIWQYSILLTVLAALFLQWTEPTGGLFSFTQKLILTIETMFVFSIFTNVLRARELMKEIEVSIHLFHRHLGCDIPLVPLELNKQMSWFRSISSTKIAMVVHFIALLIFVSLTIFVWTCR